MSYGTIKADSMTGHDLTDTLGNRKAFAERLKVAIAAAGRTQEALAADVGLSLSGFRKWLYGDTEPQMSGLVRAADALGVTIKWLATGEGPMRPGEAEPLAKPPTSASEAYDYEVVHSVAWVIADECGKDPQEFSDKFVGMCEYLQQNSANPEKEDLKKVVKIFDIAMRRRGR
jgi:transcriptional regulator with XRE-family HTH domain